MDAQHDKNASLMASMQRMLELSTLHMQASLIGRTTENCTQRGQSVRGPRVFLHIQPRFTPTSYDSNVCGDQPETTGAVIGQPEITNGANYRHHNLGSRLH